MTLQTTSLPGKLNTLTLPMLNLDILYEWNLEAICSEREVWKWQRLTLKLIAGLVWEVLVTWLHWTLSVTAGRSIGKLPILKSNKFPESQPNTKTMSLAQTLKNWSNLIWFNVEYYPSRYNLCKNMAGSFKWDWESEYAWKRAEAESVCSTVFNTPQFDACGTVIPVS